MRHRSSCIGGALNQLLIYFDLIPLFRRLSLLDLLCPEVADKYPPKELSPVSTTRVDGSS